MQAIHTHRAVASKSKDYCWSNCVTPECCAANPQRQRAHGNIVRHDVCICGAIRETEINGGRTNYGPWSYDEEAR